MGDEEKNNNEVMDVNALRTKLDQLNSDKEKWFARKEELKQKIADLIKEVRAVKVRNDELTSTIKDLKEKRDAQNSEVKKLIEQIKVVNLKKGKQVDSQDPRALHKKIEQLQMKIETGVVSFEEEKKIMKYIRNTKKILEGAKAEAEVGKEASDISRKIDIEKKKAEEFHSKMNESAKENKDAYKEFTRLSKEINRVKKEQEDAFENFIKFKQEFSELNKGIKDEMKKTGEVRKEIKRKKERNAKVKKEINHKKLEEKKEKVEEKLKNKKVLTTEDLIAFQGED
ncbi:hypothetical protein J4223_01400 [Candidatus Woesearchaeota archaeon]|nr:hypothetical protein [Candidatus Woesearchaeota archaeon]